MNTKNEDRSENDELREEYDLGSLGPGVRGKYFERATSGTNLVLLDPDVARAFPSQEAVNKALRMLAEVAEASSSGRSR